MLSNLVVGFRAKPLPVCLLVCTRDVCSEASRFTYFFFVIGTNDQDDIDQDADATNNRVKVSLGVFMSYSFSLFLPILLVSRDLCSHLQYLISFIPGYTCR